VHKWVCPSNPVGQLEDGRKLAYSERVQELKDVFQEKNPSYCESTFLKRCAPPPTSLATPLPRGETSVQKYLWWHPRGGFQFSWSFGGWPETGIFGKSRRIPSYCEGTYLRGCAPHFTGRPLTLG